MKENVNDRLSWHIYIDTGVNEIVLEYFLIRVINLEYLAMLVILLYRHCMHRRFLEHPAHKAQESMTNNLKLPS